MNFKRWLKEEKGGGGFGVFLIIIIIAAAVYAVQFGSSNLLYEPEPDFAEAVFINPEEEYETDTQENAENRYTPHNKVSNPQENIEPVNPDSLEVEQLETPEPRPEQEITASNENKTEKVNTTKQKSKLNLKPKRNSLSNKELVKRKLKQGKKVRQIADETGLNKKFIREVKRETQQVIW